MSSVREQILARMQAVLMGNTGAVNNVFRSRETSITRDICPAVVLMPEAESDENFGGMNTDSHELVVAVEIFARGDPWDSLADPVATDAHRLLMNDAALKALITRMRKIASAWEGTEADLTAGVLTMRYRVQYQTKASDISDSIIS